HQGVLHRPVEGVPHVKHTGHVRRWNRDRVVLLGGPGRLGVEVSALQPLGQNGAFGFRRRPPGRLFQLLSGLGVQGGRCYPVPPVSDPPTCPGDPGRTPDDLEELSRCQALTWRAEPEGEGSAASARRARWSATASWSSSSTSWSCWRWRSSSPALPWTVSDRRSPPRSGWVWSMRSSGPCSPG